MKFLCVGVLACTSLAGCAAGHAVQPESDLTADRLLRVEDAITIHTTTILALRDRELRDEIDKNHLLTHTELAKIDAKLDKLQESSQFPWWIAGIMGVGGPAGAYGSYRVGQTRSNGKEASA